MSGFGKRSGCSYFNMEAGSEDSGLRKASAVQAFGVLINLIKLTLIYFN